MVVLTLSGDTVERVLDFSDYVQLSFFLHKWGLVKCKYILNIREWWALGIYDGGAGIKPLKLNNLFDRYDYMGGYRAAPKN